MSGTRAIDWTAANIARVKQLVISGACWSGIAKDTGRTAKACVSVWLRTATADDKAARAATLNSKVRTPNIARVKQLVISGASWSEIAKDTGRTAKACVGVWLRTATAKDKAAREAALNRKVRTPMANRVNGAASSAPPPPRPPICAPASLTAAVFGDPLPGRSALDLRRSQQHPTETSR